MAPFLLSCACRMVIALLPLLQLISDVSATGSSEGTARAVIDAYPNTANVEQGNTLILVCRVVGVPSTTVLSYRWTCLGGSCDAGGVDPEWAARIQQGNILVVKVRSHDDSGTYTCIVQENTPQVGTASYSLSVANGLSLSNEDGRLRVFFPRNSFVTNTTLTHTDTPRKDMSIDPAVGSDHIVCHGSNDATLLVAWHNINGLLVACGVPCMACGSKCQGNGGVGVDPQEDTDDDVHRDIHMYTDSAAYVNQDLECQVSGPPPSLPRHSAFIGVYLINGETAIQPPSSITQGATSTTSVSVSWSPVSSATGYYVNYQRQDLGTPPVVTPQYERIVGGNSTSVTLSGLEPGTTYRIRVWSTNGTAVSSEAREKNVTTVERVPSPPRMLTMIGEPNGSTIELNWLPPLHPNGAIHYEIEYEPAMTPGDSVNAGNSSSPYFTLTLPNEFLTYNVRVAAVNTQGRAKSEVLSVPCLGQGRERGPEPPTDVSVAVMDRGTVVVSWTASQSRMCDVAIVNYSVKYKMRTNTGDYTTVNTSSTSVTLHGLTLCQTVYSVSVAAINSNGDTSVFSVVRNTAIPEMSPGPVRVSVRVISDDTAVVSWTTSHTMVCDIAIGNYSVMYQLWNGTGDYTIVYTSSTSITLQGLMPNTTYTVSVAAINSVGNISEFSNTTQFTTSSKATVAGSTTGPGLDAVGPAVGAVVVILLLAAVAMVIAIVFIYYKRTQKRRTKQSYTEASPRNPPIEPPTLSNLKTQEDLSSSAECLLQGEDTGVGLSTPVMSHKAIKAEVVPKHTLVAAPIPVGEFPDHVKLMHLKEKHSFAVEFKSIPLQTSESVAVGESNALKNRYKNIFPYDFSRVVLAEPDTEGNDYINASFVDGYRKDNYYIAAQAPKPQSLVDFWQMIWENRPPMVVMLTRAVEGNRRKSEDYYPEDIGGTITFGSYEVKVLAKKEYVDYEVRTMEMVKYSMQNGSDTSLTFDHYLFTGWPDYGVPKYPTSLIRMLYHVRDARVSDVPILVHCSAGVGRTGTYIALDVTLDQMKAEETVDIKGTVKRMREKRMYMVQTSEQYKFVHTAVRELLLCGDTTLKTADLRVYIKSMAQVDRRKNKPGFEALFEILNDLTEEGGGEKRVTQHEDRIRYPDRAPVSGKHLYVTVPNIGSIFINASFVDGYHAPRAFIAAEAPLQSTLTEFWTLIKEKKIATVALLCPLFENRAESCHPFWPEKVTTVHYGRHAVTLNELQSEEWETYNLTVQEEGKPPSEVTLFHYKQWPENDHPVVVTLAKLMFEVEKVQQQQSHNAPILVACNDGLGRTGTFIAMWLLIEQVKAEGQIDVVGTIKSIRTQRPGAVPRLDQFRFCHEAIQEYLNAFEGYSNFDI